MSLLSDRDGDRDYEGCPVDVVDAAMREHCEVCCAPAGHSCRLSTGGVRAPHNARLEVGEAVVLTRARTAQKAAPGPLGHSVACPTCTAGPGQVCHDRTDRFTVTHDEREEAAYAAAADRFRAALPGEVTVLPEGMTYTPIPPVEVARLRQPVPLAAVEALRGALEHAYGEELCLSHDTPGWLTVLAPPPAALLTGGPR